MLSKETTEKDRSLKTQLLIANSNSEVKEPPERVCSKAHHLFAYFLEILIRIYLKNVKDITIPFLSFSSDFSEIS